MWSYPRPPRLEAERRRVRVVFAGAVVADSERALRVLETSHPPTYYLPIHDVDPQCLRPNEGSSFCEWKGVASYYDVVVGERQALQGAWTYRRPHRQYFPLRGHVAFYCAAMDLCEVGGELARPQPGGFYGGWVTSWVKGPFKGVPGSSDW